MRSRSTILLAALALAACDRGAPGNDAVPADSLEANADIVRNEALGPSFDCTRAQGQAQQLICSDAELAAIDREVDRLQRLSASDAAAAEPTDPWVKARDECWKSDDLRHCVVDSYARRIHQLRTASAAARAAAGDARSAGPAAFNCGQEPLAATFVNTDPGLVHLAWSGHALTLAHAPSASGARYAGRVDGEPWEFWTKGNEATLIRPGGEAVTCTAPSTN
jgi:uncharacterized protein